MGPSSSFAILVKRENESIETTVDKSWTLGQLRNFLTTSFNIKVPQNQIRMILLRTRSELSNNRCKVATQLLPGDVIEIKIRGQGGVVKQSGGTIKNKTFKNQAKLMMVKESLQASSSKVADFVKEMPLVKQVEATMTSFMHQLDSGDAAEAVQHQLLKLSGEDLDKIQNLASVGGNTDYKLQKISDIFWGDDLKQVASIQQSMGGITESATSFLMYGVGCCTAQNPKYTMGTFRDQVFAAKNQQIGASRATGSVAPTPMTGSMVGDGDADNAIAMALSTARIE